VKFPRFSGTQKRTSPYATIIKALGIDPNELQAVRKEQIHVLPFLFSDGK
jgi:hypothetical protein